MASKILANITDSKINLEDEVEKYVDPVRTVDESTPLEKISFIIQKEKVVLVNGMIFCLKRHFINFSLQIFLSKFSIKFITNHLLNGLIKLF